MKALQMYQQKLIHHKVSIFVRRGGPNYQEGLRIMRELGKINICMHLALIFLVSMPVVCFCASVS